jgi:hypothetical protein
MLNTKADYLTFPVVMCYCFANVARGIEAVFTSDFSLKNCTLRLDV